MAWLAEGETDEARASRLHFCFVTLNSPPAHILEVFL